MKENIFFYIDLFLLFYFLNLNGFYIFLLIFTNLNLFRRAKEIKIQNAYQLFTIDNAPPVSVIIPCFNESNIAITSITAALNVRFPHINVIVVDDGSSDQTLQILIETYQLVSIPPIFQPKLETKPIKTYYQSKTHHNLIVIHKENGGREDAINAGINASTTPFFINIDADSVIEEEAVHRLGGAITVRL